MTEKLKVRIKKIKENAIIPGYAHEDDAGVDLYSTENYVLKPGERILVSTGLRMSIPNGYEGQIRGKSGLALYNGISLVNGVGTIDSGYHGEIQIITINHGKEDFKVEKGKKIAQMVFKKVEKVEFHEVDELDETKRNHSGFGSTGLE